MDPVHYRPWESSFTGSRGGLGVRVRKANGAYTIGCGPPIGLVEQG
jgi:hypothetical protein